MSEHDIRDALCGPFGRTEAVQFTEQHVREFFGVLYAEIEADGSVYVERPILGHYLSSADIECCLRFMSARLNCELAHTWPAKRTVVRPLRQQ